MPNESLVVGKEIIRRLLPVPLYKFLKYIIFIPKQWQILRNIKKKIRNVHQQKQHAVILMATPVHGNLGDHAIVLAEQCLLTDLGICSQIIEISNSDYILCKKQIRKYVSSKDIILIDGGGNLGTLWPWEDDKLREIIATYRRNPIIIFPQTCFYDKSPLAQERIQQNHSVYTETSNLLITLRDKQSYSFCCSHFPTIQFCIVPDIVLYLYGKVNIDICSPRDGILLCFRKDLERVVSQEDEKRLRLFLKQFSKTVKETSTVKDYGINRFSRHNELKNIWKEFASVRLVITDRLHGMIFAAINGTPCLALDNISRKVSGVYELMSDFQYIKVCSSMSEVIQNAPSYYELNSIVLDTHVLNKRYQILKDFIQKNISN